MKSILVTLIILLIVSFAWADAGTAVKASPILGKFVTPNVINNPNVGAAGGLLWKTNVGSSYYNGPTYSNKIVYSGSYGGSNFTAIYAANGATKWTSTGKGNIWSKPAVDEASGLVFFESYGNSAFYALNTSDGSTKWTYTSSVYYPVCSPAVYGDYAYFGDLNGALYKINKTTGALGWRTVLTSAGIGITRPVIHADSLVIINTYYTNYSLYATRISNGSVKWSYSTGNYSEGKGVCVGNVVYTAGNAGLFANNAITGAKLWSFAWSGGGYNWGGCTYYNNMMYAGSSNYSCYGLNSSTGTQVWSFATGSSIIFLPDAVDNIAVFGSQDSKCYGLNASTGVQNWSYTAGSYVCGAADIYDGMVFFTCYDAYCYALQVGNFSVSAGAIDGTWYSNTTNNITWTAEGRVDTVNLYYSTDSGSTWTSIAKLPDTGSYGWKVPWANSATCYVKLTNWMGNIAVNSSVFTISPGTVTVTSPNGGEKWTVGDVHNITWTATSNLDSVKIDYSTDTGSTWTAVTRAAAAAGTYAWTVPNTPSANCLVRVSNTAYTDPTDQSNAVFEID